MLLAEAAGFVETGEIFVAGLFQRLLRKAGEPQGVRERLLQKGCLHVRSTVVEFAF